MARRHCSMASSSWPARAQALARLLRQAASSGSRRTAVRQASSPPWPCWVRAAASACHSTRASGYRSSSARAARSASTARPAVRPRPSWRIAPGGGSARAATPPAANRPQHCLWRRPLPQAQGALRDMATVTRTAPIREGHSCVVHPALYADSAVYIMKAQKPQNDAAAREEGDDPFSRTGRDAGCVLGGRSGPGVGPGLWPLQRRVSRGRRRPAAPVAGACTRCRSAGRRGLDAQRLGPAFRAARRRAGDHRGRRDAGRRRPFPPADARRRGRLGWRRRCPRKSRCSGGGLALCRRRVRRWACPALRRPGPDRGRGAETDPLHGHRHLRAAGESMDSPPMRGGSRALRCSGGP